jgi:hypothetical protein
VTVPPLNQRSHDEGSQNVSLIVTPSDATIISFNALGRVLDPNPVDGSKPFTVIEIHNTTMAAADERNLTIQIPPGGSVRMCDPNPAIATTDPRHC